MLFGQNTNQYQFSKNVDGTLFSTTTVLIFTAKQMDFEFLPLKENDLLNYDFTDYYEDVPSFDRPALQNWNPQLAQASDYTLHASHILAASLMLSKPARSEAPIIGMMFIETIALTHGVTDFSKIALKRNRPYVYNSEVELYEKLNSNSRKSFFSGHTSSSAAATFFTARVFSDYYPDSKWKPIVWTAAAALPAVTGYLRYESGKHFVSDVVVGYLVGAGIGYMVPTLHKVKKQDSQMLSIDVTPMYNGVGVKSAFVF